MNPTVLLCMMDQYRDYSRSNGVRKQILEMQATSLQIPIYFVKSSWEQYENSLITAMSDLKTIYQIDGCVFGDIDTESHKLFEESICRQSGITAYLPLWGIARNDIKDKILYLGIKSKISVINKSFPIANLLGHDYCDIDFAALAKLGVDICGENGEFHTIVYDAPLFKAFIKLESQNIYNLDGVILNDFSGTTVPKNI